MEESLWSVAISCSLKVGPIESNCELGNHTARSDGLINSGVITSGGGGGEGGVYIFFFILI